MPMLAVVIGPLRLIIPVIPATPRAAACEVADAVAYISTRSVAMLSPCRIAGSVPTKIPPSDSGH
jgi:hypothetical protein